MIMASMKCPNPRHIDWRADQVVVGTPFAATAVAAGAINRSILGGLAMLSLLTACGGSDESAPPSTEPAVVTSTPSPPVGDDIVVLVETTEPTFLISETEDPGALCGGNMGGSRVAEESSLIISADGNTLLDVMAGPGTLVETVIRDDFSVASILCEFEANVVLDAIEVEPFDVLFESGRGVTVQASAVSVDQLVDGLTITSAGSGS